MPEVVNYCSNTAPFFALLGMSIAMIFSNVGAAYGTAKSAVGIAALGMNDEYGVMKNIIPVVMAGVLGIYGLIVAVIISQNVGGAHYKTMAPFDGYCNLAAGMVCGFSGMASGYAIGITGEYGTKANGIQPLLFVPMVLILIFGEALGLFGLIISIVLSQSKLPSPCTAMNFTTY